jgi:hypothetical protein
MAYSPAEGGVEPYDDTPLTVAGLRAILTDLPDDMPVWGGYDGRYAGGELAVGSVEVTEDDNHQPVYRRKTKRPVLLIDV